jgi:branched-chain amino acid transport system ATP-binding protein
VSGTASADRILEVQGLSARYGHVEALRPVDLYVDEAELVAVLGPNGAGKSTLMRALMGLVPTEGRVRFRGSEVPRRNPVAAAAMGLVLVPEGRGIFGPMTVAENLELGAYLLKGNKAELARRHERVLSLFPRLKERRAQVAGSLSGGDCACGARGSGHPSLSSGPRLRRDCRQRGCRARLGN